MIGRDEGGSAAALVVVLLPLLLTAFIGVVQLGALRVVAARAASAADLATLAAVDDQDEAGLVRTGRLRLATDAEHVARDFFARNLEQIAQHLATAPAVAARDADVGVFPDVPAWDPVTGWRYDRPTVRLVAVLPVRTPALRLLLGSDVTTIRVRSASASR